MDTLFSCRNRKISIKRSRTSRPGWRPFHLCADFGHAWKDLLQYQLLTIYTFRHFSGQVWACCCHSPDWLVVLECITVQFPCCRFARPGINFGTIKGDPKSHQDLHLRQLFASNGTRGATQLYYPPMDCIILCYLRDRTTSWPFLCVVLELRRKWSNPSWTEALPVGIPLSSARSQVRGAPQN